MIEIIKELNIEVSKPNVFQAVVAKQYDMNTRFIKATFVDGGNKIYIDPDATVKVVINALRQDGQSKGFEGEVNQDGTVTVPLHSWMLELAGTVSCDISVIDTETDDNKKLTTTGFTLLVEQAAFGGEDITSDPQFDVLVALLEASEVAQEALDKSNEANSKYDACVEATEAAKEATETLVATHDEFVSGGYVEALKELNVGGKFTFWIGTQAEYDTLANKKTNCLYMISDDSTLTELENRDYIVKQGIHTSKKIMGGQEVGNVEFYYRKWANGRCDIYGTSTDTTTIAIRTEENGSLGTIAQSEKLTAQLPYRLYGINVITDCLDIFVWSSNCTYQDNENGNAYVNYYLYRGAPYQGGNESKKWYTYIHVTGWWDKEAYKEAVQNGIS